MVTLRAVCQRLDLKPFQVVKLHPHVMPWLQLVIIDDVVVKLHYNLYDL